MIKRNPFTSIEDKIIVEYYEKNGKFDGIETILDGRSKKQARDRYNEYLNPFINKEEFTEEENEKLIKLYYEYEGRWTQIVKYFEGRTQKQIRNAGQRLLRKGLLIETKRIGSCKGPRSRTNNSCYIGKQIVYSDNCIFERLERTERLERLERLERFEIFDECFLNVEAKYSSFEITSNDCKEANSKENKAELQDFSDDLFDLDEFYFNESFNIEDAFL
jgi:hypothetical protein